MCGFQQLPFLYSGGLNVSILLQIFSTELEDVPDFQGFSTPIRNFKLFRGKQEGEEDASSEERAVGYFKVRTYASTVSTFIFDSPPQHRYAWVHF